MSTRSLTVVKINGEYKIAQYGHYDGYPLGCGLCTLLFLEKMNRTKFCEKLKKLRFAINEQEEATVFERQKAYDGADILEYIHNEEDFVVIDNLEFAKDNLFCEWAYLIDFDKNTFEIYSAFQSSEKYQNIQKKQEFKNLNLLKIYNLSKLPSEDEFKDTFDIC